MKTRKQRKTERLYKKLTNLDHSPTLTVLDMEEVTNNLYYSALIVHFVVGNHPRLPYQEYSCEIILPNFIINKLISTLN